MPKISYQVFLTLISFLINVVNYTNKSQIKTNTKQMLSPFSFDRYTTLRMDFFKKLWA